MILKQDIGQNASTMAVFAKYFKVLQLSESCQAIFRAADWELATDLKPGLSIDFDSMGAECTQIIIQSKNDQVITFWAGEAKADDSSLSGAMARDSANRFTQYDAKSISGLTEIFPEDMTRLQGVFTISAPCYVNDSVNGIELPAGLHEWTNKKSLSLIPVAGSVVVRSHDELF